VSQTWVFKGTGGDEVSTYLVLKIHIRSSLEKDRNSLLVTMPSGCNESRVSLLKKIKSQSKGKFWKGMGSEGKILLDENPQSLYS
jgi:hypothetical protein